MLVFIINNLKILTYSIILFEHMYLTWYKIVGFYFFLENSICQLNTKQLSLPLCENYTGILLCLQKIDTYCTVAHTEVCVLKTVKAVYSEH